ncbi:squalene/phytoene synthase family protein [Dokdonella sp.]|uniref:squalene/phytoene synthase family protein n=1 Tax=Dokdonella sp. TaxID=2291710 RepID=UPI0031C3502C|nr:phytoene synthase [Dokdonella sp.]
MADAAQLAPLASFEAKWLEAQPELRVALGFVAAERRQAQTAFACLALELEHAALATHAHEPAAIKLQWWADELARAGNGGALHPLTAALGETLVRQSVPLSLWHATIGAALELRDCAPATDEATLLAALAPFYAALAEIEAALFGALDVAARARQRALARAVHDTALLGEAPEDGRLALPLDLLARHRLARGDLAADSPARRAALRDWLGRLAGAQEELLDRHARLGIPGAAALRAGYWRAQRAARAAEPLAALQAASARLPFGATWAAWRAARRA